MEKYIRNEKLHPVQILALGFILIIFIGSIILSLPICSLDGTGTKYLDSLFTATSAVCVTGLVTVDTGTHFNTFGHVIILMLIQTGGLGFMSLATFAAVLFGKKITLRDRLIMQESINAFKIEGLVRMVEYIITFTFIVEFIGALLLMPTFLSQFSFGKSLFYSVFHSVSAFCNAGFDLNGNFSSITMYSSNSFFIFVLSTLIIIGGLGFSVIIELFYYKRTRKLSVNSKIVLVTTGILIVAGTVLMFLFEYNNMATIGTFSLKDKIVNSYFNAVTPRTAGFNSVSTDGMTMAGKLLTVILMFIGGSSGSTAGGIKTATFGIIILTVICVLRGREETEAFGRKFSKDIIYKAITLVTIGVMWVIMVTMLLSLMEPDEPFINLLYEASSAFGTAGLTTGVTQKIGTVSKIILIITMYMGRVGPLTVFFAIVKSSKKKGYKYPEGKILIG